MQRSWDGQMVENFSYFMAQLQYKFAGISKQSAWCKVFNRLSKIFSSSKSWSIESDWIWLANVNKLHTVFAANRKSDRQKNAGENVSLTSQYIYMVYINVSNSMLTAYRKAYRSKSIICLASMRKFYARTVFLFRFQQTVHRKT